MQKNSGLSLFILSPANLSGIRAKRLLAEDAKFLTAIRYRSASGMSVGEVFEYLSPLYFRGKLAYARRFGRFGVLIIAPGFGLVPPEWKFTPDRALHMCEVPVDSRVRAYRDPLERHCRELESRSRASEPVILLGSLARRKYLDVLLPVFQERLQYPAGFESMGDMKRGSLLLRAAKEGGELRYEPAIQISISRSS